MKYAWIDAQRREFPLPDMCEVLSVSISGYRAWRRGGKPDRTRLTDPQAVALMKSIHAEVKGAYGSRRMHQELHGRGHRIGLPQRLSPDELSLVPRCALVEDCGRIHCAAASKRGNGAPWMLSLSGQSQQFGGVIDRLNGRLVAANLDD